MLCWKCHRRTVVIDSRPNANDGTVLRRRKCANESCGVRFSTREERVVDLYEVGEKQYIPPRESKQARNAEIFLKYSQGLTYTQLADLFCLSYPRISQIVTSAKRSQEKKNADP